MKKNTQGRFKNGERVAIVSVTANGQFFVEGFGSVIAPVLDEDGKPGDQFRVALEGLSPQIVERFIDPAAQADPYEFVSQLNLRMREAAAANQQPAA